MKYNPLSQFKNDLPHLVVYGEPSSGKHRYVQQFLNEMYEPYAHYRHAVKWLNCVNPEIQQDLLNQVKQIGTSVYRPWEKHAHKYRVIVLDGMEFIPYSVQASLRRCIEVYSQHTRFILIGCSYETLMKPIQSRFILFEINKKYHERENQVLFKQAQSELCSSSLSSLSSLSSSMYINNQPTISIVSRESPVSSHPTEMVELVSKELTHMKLQIQWLMTYKQNIWLNVEEPNDASYKNYAQIWVNQGWSSVDLMNGLVYETMIMVNEYDSDIRQQWETVWKEVDIEKRYNLWNTFRGIHTGQSYEWMLVAWIFGQLRLLFV